MARKRTTKQMIKAISGSGGIISTIARRLEVDWHTAEKYIDMFPSVKKAYQDEVERILDMAEGVILESVKAEDIASAKWYLTKKGKKRGYGDETEVNLKGFLSFAEIIKEKVKQEKNGNSK